MNSVKHSTYSLVIKEPTQFKNSSKLVKSLKNIKKYHYIYKITNLINNIVYIGRRSTNTLPEHDKYFGSGADLKLAIKEIGGRWFIKEIIEYADSFGDLVVLEELYVTLKEVSDSMYYNKVVGGAGNGTIGMKFSEETKRKQSNRKKGVYSGKNHPQFGRRRSKETKKKIGNAQRGKTISEAHRRSNSEKLKGRVFSKEHSRKKSDAQMGGKNPYAKPITIEGVFYETKGLAAKELGITRSVLDYRIKHSII